jgi:hypothetical protein
VLIAICDNSVASSGKFRQFLMGLSEGLAALGAAEALSAIAVLSEAPCFDPAIVARHL